MTALQRSLLDLADSFGLLAIYAFGSRAGETRDLVRGDAAALTAGPSDLDIGVQPCRGVYLSVAQRVELAQRLEDLFGVTRVDLVLCPEASPFLAQEIVSGELLCCTDADAQAEHELYVLRRAGDLEPFERERRRLILEEGAR